MIIPAKKLNVGEPTTIENLRLELAAKLATVHALMQGFQRAEFPIVRGLTFDVLYRPAATLEQLGGDWYDIFTLPDGRVAFTLGDVCGRGLAAAVKMGQAKQAIKVAASLQDNDPMPLAVLNQTNKVIFLNDRQGEFTTAIYGVDRYDGPQGHVRFRRPSPTDIGTSRPATTPHAEPRVPARRRN